MNNKEAISGDSALSKDERKKEEIMDELYNHLIYSFAENKISKIEGVGMLHAFIFRIEQRTEIARIKALTDSPML